jgi:hypothetical protein
VIKIDFEKLREYLKENKRVSEDLDLKNIRRISVAPVCPYWSPIVPSEIDFPIKAEKRKYKGLSGIDFTMYKQGKTEIRHNRICNVPIKKAPPS